MPALPFSRHSAIAGASLLVLVLFLAGRFLLRGEAVDAVPVAARPAASVAARPARLVVHVVGAVRRPGLYRLPPRSRIADAVARAGGATRRADLALVNLAAPVADGVQIVVPRRVPPAGDRGGAASDADAGTPAGPVHLNTATLEQLDSLPGIGPVTAQKILDFRRQHGAFSSVDSLDAIPGIGPARIEQLREAAAP